MRWAALLIAALPFALAGCFDDDGQSEGFTPPPGTTGDVPSTGPGTTAPTFTTWPPANGTTPTTSPTGTPLDVAVGCDYFDPDNATVPAGATVRWHHQCGTHSVTVQREGAPNGTYVHDEDPFESGTTEYTFEVIDRYRVFCRYHEGMEMDLRVT
jgi:plastocyanin